jgi:hypothetical protein
MNFHISGALANPDHGAHPMAKATKRIARKSRRTITTIEDAAAVYGGAKKMAKAFRAPTREIKLWSQGGLSAACPSSGHGHGVADERALVGRQRVGNVLNFATAQS